MFLTPSLSNALCDSQHPENGWPGLIFLSHHGQHMSPFYSICRVAAKSPPLPALLISHVIYIIPCVNIPTQLFGTVTCWVQVSFTTTTYSPQLYVTISWIQAMGKRVTDLTPIEVNFHLMLHSLPHQILSSLSTTVPLYMAVFHHVTEPCFPMLRRLSLKTRRLQSPASESECWVKSHTLLSCCI